MDKYIIPADQRSALESLRQPFAIFQYLEKRPVTLLVSSGLCELFGYKSPSAALGNIDNDLYQLTHPDDVARLEGAALQFATQEEKLDVLFRLQKPGEKDYHIFHAQGQYFEPGKGIQLSQVWLMDEGAYVQEAENCPSQINMPLSRTLYEQNVMIARRYDFLTGLPNMTSFFERAEEEKKRIVSRGESPCLLYFDFNGMKFFNAKHGFAAGDKIIQFFSRLLVENFHGEQCCRIGVDHFAALVGEKDLEEKLNRLFHQFGELYEGKTPPVHVGIYPYKAEDVSISEACDRAKLACKEYKGSYGSGFQYYSPKFSESSELRQYFIENLDTAIKEKWIQVYLQPIIRAVNEKVCDVEALARWVDPQRGILSPASFIPALEEAGLIYKLDLYMLDQVLESIKLQMAEGLFVVSHSINLSRSDFDACDMVEEFCKRVDAAGVRRDRITVEITESIIGSDFEFMKKQVERFQSLGFPVWMDDFGSGYSSLDVLQSIRFDLIKFDMSFLRKLDSGEEGKVILTELMRMATSLGVDTVCEGVETQSQIRFLKEIGCSKLQGYYYSKPLPFEAIRQLHKNATLIVNENPKEVDYYESVGRVNLFDLGVFASGDESLQSSFQNLPIAVLEILEDRARYIRTNPSYTEFVKRFFDIDLLKDPETCYSDMLSSSNLFSSVLKQCKEVGTPLFFDERMKDGSIVHTFARRVSINPVTEAVAIALAILSITQPEESTTYADIARALAADYYNIYVINLENDSYIEYSSRVGEEELSIERHGEHFFESAKKDTMVRIYEEDREPFLKWFTKENILQELKKQGLFTATYRLIDSGTPIYVNMKITQMQGGNRLILGVSIVDAQMKQLEEEKRLRQERVSLRRIASLSPDYLVLYTVNLQTGAYTQYNPSKEYELFDLAQQGEDFFKDAILDAPKVIDPLDIERYLRIFTRKNILREIQKNGYFIHNYRLLIKEESVPVSLKATLLSEEAGEMLLLGVSIDNRAQNQRRLEEAYERERDQSTIFTHIAQALARGCTDLYYVNMDTNGLIEYHTEDEKGVLTQARRGSDFFEGCDRDALLYVHPDDQHTFVTAMKRDFLENALSASKVFEMVYRRIKYGRTFYVRMKVSRVEEDPRYIVIAVYDIDEEMKATKKQT